MGQDDSSHWLIDAGSSSAGAAVGAGIGLVGGPPGVVAGAAIGSALSSGLRRTANELRRRVLGHREEARLNAALQFAADAVQARLDNGERPRRDWFVDSADEDDGRKAADEVIEGVLTSAERDYEESKLRFYGELLASIAFRDDVSRADANYLVRTVRELSYRQICLLTLSGRRPLAITEFNGIPREDARAVEVLDLAERRLVKEEPSGRRVVQPWSNGQLLIELLGLDTLTDDEIESVVAISSGRSIG